MQIHNSVFPTQSVWFQNMNKRLFKFDINSCDLDDKMKKILHVILISLLSFTVVSCAKKDEAETDSATGKIIVYAVNYSL